MLAKTAEMANSLVPRRVASGTPSGTVPAVQTR